MGFLPFIWWRLAKGSSNFSFDIPSSRKFLLWHIHIHRYILLSLQQALAMLHYTSTFICVLNSVYNWPVSKDTAFLCLHLPSQCSGINLLLILIYVSHHSRHSSFNPTSNWKQLFLPYSYNFKWSLYLLKGIYLIHLIKQLFVWLYPSFYKRQSLRAPTSVNRTVPT